MKVSVTPCKERILQTLKIVYKTNVQNKFVQTIS